LSGRMPKRIHPCDRDNAACLDRRIHRNPCRQNTHRLPDYSTIYNYIEIFDINPSVHVMCWFPGSREGGHGVPKLQDDDVPASVAAAADMTERRHVSV
ncbi:MAG: hypothetical protein ACRYFY_16005, partial [Janthinobacterium lividum]